MAEKSQEEQVLVPPPASSDNVVNESNGHFNSADENHAEASPSRREKRSRSRERRKHRRRHRSRSRSSSHSPRRKRSRRHRSRSPRSRSNSRERSSKRQRYDDHRSSRRDEKYEKQQQQHTQQEAMHHAPVQHEETEEERIARVRRTIFVYHLSPNVDDRMLTDFFVQRAGPVKTTRLIRDRFTGRSKGFGYVEFANEDSVRVSLALAGTKLDGHEVLVKASEAEKNIIHSAQTGGGAITNLFFKPVPDELDEDDLRLLFESVGEVESIELRKNMQGQRLGYGYVKYRKPDDAKKALIKINNVEIAGYKIKVGMWFEEGSQQQQQQQAPIPMQQGNPFMLQQQQQQYPMQQQQQHMQYAQPMGGASSSYHGEEEGGYNKSAQTKAMMIEKYKAVENGTTTLVSSTPAPPAQEASQNILLTNMFDPESESDPNFDQEIKSDVQSECSKYGSIAHCWVDKHSKGHVYLRFNAVESAQRCQQVLNGRWFAKKLISATFMPDSAYFTKFPELIL